MRTVYSFPVFASTAHENPSVKLIPTNTKNRFRNKHAPNAFLLSGTLRVFPHALELFADYLDDGASDDTPHHGEGESRVPSVSFRKARLPGTVAEGMTRTAQRMRIPNA